MKTHLLNSELSLNETISYRTRRTPSKHNFLVLDCKNYYYYLRFKELVSVDSFCLNDNILGINRIYYDYAGKYYVVKKYRKPSQMVLNFDYDNSILS